MLFGIPDPTRRIAGSVNGNAVRRNSVLLRPSFSSERGYAMLDHITIAVSNYWRSRAFYDAALTPLGITRLFADGDKAAGYGQGAKAFFWIAERNCPPSKAHVAFEASQSADIEAFYSAALAHGGRASTTWLMLSFPRDVLDLVVDKEYGQSDRELQCQARVIPALLAMTSKKLRAKNSGCLSG